MKPDRRSPLKDKPLRVPGQSVEDQLADAKDDYVIIPLAQAWFAVVLAGYEWWRAYAASPPHPILISVLAVCVVLYSAFKLWRGWPRIRALRLARDGERAVGQYLERLRERGYQVFHDVIGQGFNVDHILIGPAGVFTIETKTRSKPERGQTKVSFDGENLQVGGFEPDRNPVVQAKAQAAWLRQLLAESTGKQFAVRPVILFPGWFVECAPGCNRELWVLEPKALPAFLDQSPAVIPAEDAKLAGFHLSRFVRTEERRRAPK